MRRLYMVGAPSESIAMALCTYALFSNTYGYTVH